MEISECDLSEKSLVVMAQLKPKQIVLNCIEKNVTPCSSNSLTKEDKLLRNTIKNNVIRTNFFKKTANNIRSNNLKEELNEGKGGTRSIDSYDDQVPNELKDHSMAKSKVIFGHRESVVHTSYCQQK